MTQLLNRLAALLGLVLALTCAPQTHAAVAGISGPTFNLTAKADQITTGDANSVLVWSYANGLGTLQYPGPTLIVNQGEVVTVNLTNSLPVATSIVFPGQSDVTAIGGSAGLQTAEAAANGGTVSYTFTASQPGTYLYQSGTKPALQIEMGLVGALVVRPAGVTKQAYAHAGSAYDREYLLLLTEMDPTIHLQVAQGNLSPDTSDFFAVQWYINGRNGMDTLYDNGIPWMQTQPYGSMVLGKPGEKLLLRLVNAGRDAHPFHVHGNNITVIARDARLLESAPGMGPDLAWSDFTIKAIPGATYDGVFTWTGRYLGWDMYGYASNATYCNQLTHLPTVSYPATTQDDSDRCKPIPVTLPNQLDLTYGMHYSGSPYLGSTGTLPPGSGEWNPYAGYFFMWHSHSEKELTNNDIFPGGMLTMFVVVPPNYSLPTE
ncbi:multicopper oxidase domain-containing protein [Rhodoferax ferrireducens]|uniref:multicopper oxidase domain-containing protein n=1 Tax=Rhodoferax ferrireducens TaxID=192843 RepID=UPI000E0D91E0|nr:multicopper oxidase domain-containing protein [Rhodoferax ferrireducens]